ncbi:hypothetical protein Tco_0041736, partial [Tanacetum coccineum]
WGRNPVCPYCSGGFVQELNEVVDPGQLGMGPTHAHKPSDYGYMKSFPDPRNRIMDAFAELTRQRIAGQSLANHAWKSSNSQDWMREGQSRIKGQDQKLGERLKAWKLHSSPIKGASHTHWDHLG